MKIWHETHALMSFQENERSWTAQNLDRDADRAFDAARRRSVERHIRNRLGLGSAKSLRYPERPSSAIASLRCLDEACLVPIDEIAGLEDGGVLRPFPVIRAGLRSAWKRAYAKEDRERYHALEACERDGAWFLSGGITSYILLEVLRSAGVAEIKIAAPRSSLAEGSCRILGKDRVGRYRDMPDDCPKEREENSGSPGLAC